MVTIFIFTNWVVKLYSDVRYYYMNSLHEGVLKEYYKKNIIDIWLVAVMVCTLQLLCLVFIFDASSFFSPSWLVISSALWLSQPDFNFKYFHGKLLRTYSKVFLIGRFFFQSEVQIFSLLFLLNFRGFPFPWSCELGRYLIYKTL